MTSQISSRRFWIPIAVTLAAFLISSHPADAQDFKVESTSIDNGAVNVPTTLDISVTFSEAIATVGLPDVEIPIAGLELDLVNEGCAALPVLLVITPAGCPESWSLTDDGKTLVLENVLLAEDQIHTMLVLFAISADGDVLNTPHATRFSTGDSIDQGSVSGTASSSNLDVTGSMVILTGGDVLDFVSSEDTLAIDPLIGFVDESGNYTISFAPDGEYFAMAVQLDLTALGGLVSSTAKATIEGLGVGLHDRDDDGVADLVVIASGGATTGIDIVLSSEGATIKDLQGPIEALITADVPTARLSLGAGGGLEPDGTGLIWMYIFTDLISGQAWLSAGIGQVAFPPSRIDENEDFGPIALLLATAMFTDYADSDQAMQWYLAAGGQDFLDANPDAIGAGILMDRLLFDLFLELIQNGGLTFVPGFEVWSEVLQFDHVVDGIKGVLPKTQALEAWILVYIGTDTDELGLHLVALGDDGTPLLVMGSSPAGDNENHAATAAAAWAGDANLVSVDALALPVTPSGNAIVWSFNYFSPAKDSVLSVIVSGGDIGGVLMQTVLPKDEVTSTDPLITNWIDSPEAIAAADQIAAGFFASHVGVSSTAILTMGLQPGHPERGIWRVVYTGGSDDGTTEEMIVDIDASNGVFVAVEDEGTVPGAFSLKQNYPNPFNPETVIQYQVGEAGDVSLSIFNLLGQEVRVLVEGRLTEGSYSVRWDARDASGNFVPSGVYLYRFESANSVETRRMTLVR